MTSLIPVEFQWRKYDGTPHWVHQTFFLGTDEFGHWFGQRALSYSARPGLNYTTETNTVMLVSVDGDHVAKFFPAGRDDGMELYVDLAHEVTWNPELSTVTGIDMDLDVLKSKDRGVWIEDIDEFHTHKTFYSYPEALINHSWAKSRFIEAQVHDKTGAFDGRAEAWLEYFEENQ
jgi:hypothetical protein